jgi:hypothetical protein
VPGPRFEPRFSEYAAGVSIHSTVNFSALNNNLQSSLDAQCISFLPLYSTNSLLLFAYITILWLYVYGVSHLVAIFYLFTVVNNHVLRLLLMWRRQITPKRPYQAKRHYILLYCKLYNTLFFAALSCLNSFQFLGEKARNPTATSFILMYRGPDKSLARPTSRCILFDG